MNNLCFEDLFVLDIGSNHGDCLEYGKNIISELGKISKDRKVRVALKFEFYDRDLFVSPSISNNQEHPRVERNESARFDWEQLEELKEEVVRNGMLTICNPLDENSVQRMVGMNFDYIQLASSSAQDWPLLTAAADANLPVVLSTGGLGLEQIDSLVNFFAHRGVPHAMIHCTSEFPALSQECQLNQINVFQEWYPDHVIGWSSQEYPIEPAVIQIAYAKGARMFERRVMLSMEVIKLRPHSSTPEQIDAWFAAWQLARGLCGSTECEVVTVRQQHSLNLLQRGVFCRRPVNREAIIKHSDVQFAVPWQEGQLPIRHWREGVLACKPIKAGEALMESQVIHPPELAAHTLKDAIYEVKALLNRARVALNNDFQIEFSHHNGIQNFCKTGATIINCINREYCKKIIVQLAGQSHPCHFHKRKEETFHVLSGVLEAELDGHQYSLHPGKTLLIQPGIWHRFWSKTGCVFEEISTTHFNDDSTYRDQRINGMDQAKRKTIVENWEQFELQDTQP